MPRKRIRDWQIRNMRYAIVDCALPQEFWDQAKKMRSLWNSLCLAHEEVRKTIDDKTPEDDRKAKWAAFELLSKQLTKDSGLNWCCGPDILDRFTKACIAAAKSPEKGWPQRQYDLRVSIPHRFTGGGMPVENLTSKRANRIRFMTPTLHRITNKNIEGIFGVDGGSVDFTACIHRPLPADSIVKTVRWTGRFSRALGWKWHLIITIEEEPGEPRISTGKTAAIDVGWRKRGESLRFGYLVDSDGRSEEFLLPLDFSTSSTRRQNRKYPEWEKLPETYKDLRDLMALRDGKLEKCKADLREVLKLNPLPAGLEKMRKRGLQKTLFEYMKTLAGEPIRGKDGEMIEARSLTQDETAEMTLAVEILSSWNEWDMPRYRRQSRASERFAGSRADRYQNLAVKLAKQYDTIYCESVSIKDMAEEDDKGIVLNAADRYRQIAAPGAFLACLQTACKKYGSELIKRDAVNSTLTCHVCGAIATCGESKRAELIMTCPNGHSWDQDENAARNLISANWTGKPAERRVAKKRRKREVAEAGN